MVCNALNVAVDGIREWIQEIVKHGIPPEHTALLVNKVCYISFTIIILK